MENLQTPEWKYRWVFDQWKNDEYQPVQEKFDVPYDKSPAPSKIPGAALEFDISSLGDIESVHLYLDEAVCEIKWKEGARLLTFVHATEPVGRYQFEGLNQPLPYELVPPAYNLEGIREADNPVTGQDLRRLEYPEGKVVNDQNSTTYDQEGWGGFKYQVSVDGKNTQGTMEGCWGISSRFPGWEEKLSAKEVVKDYLQIGVAEALRTHTNWWDQFWVSP